MADLSAAANELETLARNLREAGGDSLVRKLSAALREGAKPVPDMIRAELIPHLPDPYAAVLDSDLRIGVNARTGGRDPGVSVTGTPQGKARKLRRLDAGLLTHPTFGYRGPNGWHTQGPEGGGMRPGWFTGPAEKGAAPVREAIERALGEIADEAMRTGKL